jgi:hypothetical protein
MSVSTIETPARTQNSGARDWLQNHWDEVFASVPRGTIWAVLSRDGKHVLFYGNDSEQLRRKSASLGEPNLVLPRGSQNSSGRKARGAGFRPRVQRKT